MPLLRRHAAQSATLACLLLAPTLAPSFLNVRASWARKRAPARSRGSRRWPRSRAGRRSLGAAALGGQARAAREGDEAGRQLLRWLAEEGAEVSPALDVALDAPLGRELLVTEAVDEGEDLVKLPPELCIPAPDILEEVPGSSAWPEDVRLAAELLEASDLPCWEAYKAVWPGEASLEESLPVFWPDERIQALASTMPRLQAQVGSRRQLLADAAGALKTSAQRLTWAHALVSTRAIGASIDACAMIPGVDLANHSPDPNADLVVAGTPGLRTGRATVAKHGKVWEHGAAGLVASRDLSAGEVVRISYGKYPNQRFLLDYGFSLGQDNPAGEEEKEEEESR